MGSASSASCSSPSTSRRSGSPTMPTCWRRPISPTTTGDASAVDELHGLIVDALSHPALRRRGVDAGRGPSLRPRSRCSIRAMNWLGRGSKRHRRRSCSPSTPSSSPARPASSNHCRGAATSASPSVRTPSPAGGASTSSCRDRAGILARLTWALADADLNIVAASLVTWPDGGVLDSFVVSSGQTAEPPRPGGTHGAGGPWPATVHRPDRRGGDVRRRRGPVVHGVRHSRSGPFGLLASIASAFDDAKVDVHAARLASRGRCRRRRSRFEVTDRYGRKLDAGRKAAVRRALGVAD